MQGQPTIERIGSSELESLLPLLEWRLTGRRPVSFSLPRFLSEVGKHYAVRPDHADMLREFLDVDRLRLYAAAVEHSYAGYASCLVQPKPNFLLCWYVDELWVAEPYRRMGIASALLRRIETDARGAGAIQVRLYVSEQNGSARACYAKNGFRETAEARFCVRDLT